VTTDWQFEPQEKPTVLENLKSREGCRMTATPAWQASIAEEIYCIAPMSYS
jgi:hypothetical protein